METLEKIRERLGECDDIIIDALAKRMDIIQEIIQYKKQYGLAILQPEQEKKQQDQLMRKLNGHGYQDEILDIFTYIVRNSKKIQAKVLFSYNIMLVGFMGAGKSTVSAFLGKMLAMEEIETDQMIVDKEQMSISDIFDVFGEEYFRNCESNAIIEMQKRTNTVVSCGGGIVLRDENVRQMKKCGKIVLLTASPETIYERVKDSTERPILNNNMNVPFIAQLMEKRREKYEQAADVVVNTDGKDVLEICEDLIAQLTALRN